MAYISLGGGQYERVIRELLVVLRYRVQLYKSVNNQWLIKCTVRHCIFVTIIHG